MKKYRSLIILFLVLGTLYVANVAQTNSKYVDSKTYAFAYQNNVYKVYFSNAIATNDISTDEKNVKVNYTFTTSEVGLGLKDSYYLNREELSPNCIVSYKDQVINAGNLAFVSFNNIKIPEEITLTITCPVDEVTNSGNITMPISIDEKIEDEDKFPYTDGNFIKKRSTFDSEHAKTTLYDILKRYLDENYYDKYVREVYSSPDLIITDIESYLKPYENVLISGGVPTGSITNNLLGIKVTYNNEPYSFSYDIDDNFIGYARTSAYISHVSSLPVYMYFSSNDKDKINQVFTTYLTMYEKNFFPGEENVLERIDEYLDYMELKIGENLYDVYSLQTKGSIGGIRWETAKDLKGNLYIINISSLIAHAQNYKNSPIVIDVSKTLQDIYSSFYNGLLNTYLKNDIISTEAIGDGSSKAGYLASYSLDNEILTGSVFKNSIYYQTGTSGKVDKVSFRNYHIFYDVTKKNYLLIHAASSPDLNYNLIDIAPLTVSKEEKDDFIRIDDISFKNNSTKVLDQETKEEKTIEEELEITLTMNIDTNNTILTNTEKIKAFVSLLETSKMLNIKEEKITNDDGSFGANKANIISDSAKTTLTFTVTKKV